MKNIVKDTNLIAYCGLYCGSCPRYLKEKCPGCKENSKASWCKLRTCCIENNFKTCANCKDFPDVLNCKKYNNIFARFFSFIFRSNRAACIQAIKTDGEEKFAQDMTDKKRMTLPR